MSRPSWARGLKQLLRVHVVISLVAPFVAAWVETIYASILVLILCRALRGRVG